MNAFDNHKKQKMPDITAYSTEQLLAIIAQGQIQGQALSALNEIVNNRIIKSGDADDDAQHRGGTRPTHQPINP